jgi:tetratricopeptide (TPR) repeat protein
MNRRKFLGTTLIGGNLLWLRPEWISALQKEPSFGRIPFPVQFLKPSPYAALFHHVEPGYDEFTAEKRAFEIAAHLNRLLELRSLPLAADFRGSSPMPKYSAIAEGIFQATFDLSDRNFQEGLEHWFRALGHVRDARFFVTEIQSPDPARASVTVRYEISSRGSNALHYRVGRWKQIWNGNRLLHFEPLDETLAVSATPLFTDMTEHALGAVESFRQQMLRGVPYWRARLDVASGIDVYGNNGIAVGDIDNDGRDEIYVCQPGGLPNRLYKIRTDGRLEDITERAGVGALDDTASALFVDFRNSGHQDLVVLRSSGPLLFLNEGGGRFHYKPDAFRFAGVPQGTFTGMSAADFDRDGRVDLYLCCYIYFQSEDQYRYPVPYHDAQNGPPNFLFRNRLTTGGGGAFEDVTDAVGLNQNNNRYSFAAAWCDYNGDGWPDLYVANDFGRNNLYRNNSGRFQDVAAEAGVEDIGPGMSAAWFDFDGDGRPDLYVSNMWTAAGQRIIAQKEFHPAANDALKSIYHRHTKGNSLYRNRGDGRFEEKGAAEGVEMGRWAWSADGFDFDNDGSPEIYIAAGMITHSPQKDLSSFFWRQVVARTPLEKSPAPGYENGWNALNQLVREDYSWNGREPNVFYARRNGRYYDLSGISGLDFAEDSRAFAATDLDGDGNLDLVLKSRLGPQVRLLRNQCGRDRHSLAIQLRGVKSNRDAIGARVQVELAATSSKRKHITQFVQAGSGYLSQHIKVLYFGLGGETTASAVRIQWPSGLQQEFHNLAAGRRYEITEGADDFRSTAFLPNRPEPAPQQRSFNASRASVKGDNGPRMHPTWLLEPVPLPEKLRGPAFLCLVAGQSISAPEGVPFQIVDLDKESPDVAAWYALFRRYLFDWRSDLTLPLVFLFDKESRAHKIYPDLPEASVLRSDFAAVANLRAGDASGQRRALPFAGRYYEPPRRRYFQLGAAFLAAGYPEQAALYLENVLRDSPANFKALLALGQAHLEAGRLGAARKYLERALAVNSQSPEVWNNLGGVEMAAENYRGALDYYQRALNLRSDLPYALVNAGQAQARLGNTVAAEELFGRALQLDPNDADAANQLGLLLAAQNKVEEARNYFQKAIASKRDHAGAINNLAVLYAQINKTDDAIAALQYGIQVAPDADNLYLNLARLYVRMGNRDRAREVLQRLQARKPNSSAAARALAELGDR